MEHKDLKEQLKALMSLGYNKEEIMKIATTTHEIFSYTPEDIKSILNTIEVSKEELVNTATTAPEIFNYTPEDIKSVLNTIKVSKAELVNTASNMQLIADGEKNQRKR